MKQGAMGERQRWTWIAAGLSAAVAAAACGLGWIWVLAGGGAVTAYYICMDRNLSACGAAVLLPVRWGIAGRIAAALVLLWTVLVMGWTALLADAAFPMVDGFPALGWILLLLAGAGCCKGAAACARCAGVLCLFLVALYGVIVGFSLPDVTWKNVSLSGTWQDSLWATGLFLLPGAVWYLPCSRSRKKTAWSLLLILPVCGAVLAAVTAGVLTPELAADLPAPLYTLAQSVSLFGVLERIEPLLSAAMTMGVFCLLSVQSCACSALGKALGLGKWTGAAACAAAGAVMFPVRDLPRWVLGTGCVLFWVLLPLLCLGKRDKIRECDPQGIVVEKEENHKR